MERAFSDAAWRAPPAQLDLSCDQVHVWRVRLDVAEYILARLRATLTPDESARAARIPSFLEQDRYVAARGVLRAILGRYLGTEPGQVRFEYGPQGKPALWQAPGAGAPWKAAQTPPATVTFNLAHSHGLALLAVARGREVGIDVERIQADLVEQGIAERFFSPAEMTALDALPKDDQLLAFFRCWTRKEAWVKARGQGLTIPLDRFDVSVAPNEPPALLRVAGAAASTATKAEGWSLCDLTPAPGYAAALAVEGSDWQLQAWDWPNR